jgi:hypothetical protein
MFDAVCSQFETSSHALSLSWDWVGNHRVVPSENPIG